MLIGVIVMWFRKLFYLVTIFLRFLFDGGESGGEGHEKAVGGGEMVRMVYQYQ